MCPYIPPGEPRKEWIQYFEDGSYEPVNRNENLNNKPIDRRNPEWMVLTEKPDWRPEKYANTKRGQQAKRELGTRQQAQQASQAGQTQSLFAPKKETTKSPDVGNVFGLGNLPGFGGTIGTTAPLGSDLPENGGFTGQMKKPAAKPNGPTSLMTASMEEINGLLAGLDKRNAERKQKQQAKQPQQAQGYETPVPTKLALGQQLLGNQAAQNQAVGSRTTAQQMDGNAPAKPNQPAAQARPKTPLPAPIPPEAKDDRQPHQKLSGKASVQLGGPEDGKVTMLDEYLRPIEEEPQRDAAGRLGPAALVAAEAEARRKQNADPSVDHPTEQEKRKEQAKQGKTGSQAVQDKKAEELAKLIEAEIINNPAIKGTQAGKDAVKLWEHYKAHPEDLDNAFSDALAEKNSEKRHTARKRLRTLTALADLVPLPPQAAAPLDAAAYFTTTYDILDADVSKHDKNMAGYLNMLGTLGFIPGLDIPLYEAIAQKIKDVPYEAWGEANNEVLGIHPDKPWEVRVPVRKHQQTRVKTDNVNKYKK